MSRLQWVGSRHVGKSSFGAIAIPYRWLRVYDDSAGYPASPAAAATGRLLLEIDLTGSVWIGPGPSGSLSSPITGQVQLLGYPLYMRFVSNDGLTVTDTPYALGTNTPDTTQEVIEDNSPDGNAVNYPGPWMPGTDVAFDAGDLVYVP